MLAPPSARAQADVAAAAPGRVLGVITAQVPPGRPIRVAIAHRHSDLMRLRYVREMLAHGPGPFVIPDVPPGKYAIGAVIDMNGNGQLDREIDAYALQREWVVVEPGADSAPVELAAFANAAPQFSLAPAAREQLLAQVAVLDQTVVGIESEPDATPRTHRRASTLRYRLRNVHFWSTRPGTREDQQFLFAEVAAVAAAVQTLAQGGDPEAADRGPVRRAVLSAQYGSHWPYALYIPPNYDPARAWPLFVVLHGAGGNADNMLLSVGGALPWGWRALQGRGPFPPFPERDAFILCPFGLTTDDPFDGYKANVAEVLASLDAVQADYNIDPHATYLAGFSMGGGGVWRIGLDHPGRFAALAPVSSTLPLPLTDAGRAPQLPVLAVHGVWDHVIPIVDTRAFIAARQAAGGRAELREYPDDGHLLPDFEMADLFAELEQLGATRKW